MGLIVRRRYSSKDFTPSRPSPLAEGPGKLDDATFLDPLIRSRSDEAFSSDLDEDLDHVVVVPSVDEKNSTTSSKSKLNFTAADLAASPKQAMLSANLNAGSNSSVVQNAPEQLKSWSLRGVSDDDVIGVTGKYNDDKGLSNSPPVSPTTTNSAPNSLKDGSSAQELSPSSSTDNSSSTSSSDTIKAPIDIYAWLREFSLFKNAPTSFFSALVHKLKPLHVPPQRFVLTQGDEAKTMYWIVKGSIGITSRDGETTYAELQPGDFFGEIGLLFDRPRTANAISRSKCLLMSLSADSLNAILPSFPSVERAIRDEAQERLVVLERVKKSLNSAADSEHDNENEHNHHREGSYSGANDFDFELQDGSRKRRQSESDSDSASEIDTDDDESTTRTKINKTVFYNTFSEDDGLYDYVISMERAKKRKLAAASQPINGSSSSISTTIAASIDQAPTTLTSKSAKTTGSNFYLQLDNTPFLFLKDILKEIPLFQSLPTHILHELAMSVEPVTYPAFDYIFKQGSPGKDIYFIVQGTAEVLLEPTADMKDARHLATIKEGSYVGEMAFLSMSPYRTASVRTVTQVDCLVITESTLISLCGGFPDIQTEFLRTAANRKLKNPTSIDLANLDSSSNLDNLGSSLGGSGNLKVPESLDISSKVAETFDSASQAEAACAAAGAVSAGASRFASFLNPRRASSSRTISTFRRRGSRFNIGIFPANVLVNIFQCLELPELMKLQLVCQQWRHILLNSKSLMYTLDLSKYNKHINDRTIVPIIQFAGTRPKEVDISNCFHLTDDGFYNLVNSIGLSQVKKFKMKSVWEVSGMSIMDLSAPSIGSELEEIDLSNCRKVDDLTVIRLVGWVVPHTSADGVTPITFPPPGTVVGCPKLKRVNFGYCKSVTDRTMFHIATYASDRLESLDMTRCTSITDVGFSYWDSKQFPKLKYVNLSDCTFLTDRAIINLTKSSPYLEELNLSFCCALSDIAVEAIGINCPNLRRLNLAFCGSAVSDKSLASLSHRLPRLEELSVRGCVRVTNASINLLWKMCPMLKTLNTTQCKNVIAYPTELDLGHSYITQI